MDEEHTAPEIARILKREVSTEESSIALSYTHICNSLAITVKPRAITANPNDRIFSPYALAVQLI